MPNKVDYRTFSQRVKNKYPEYINMGDLELAQMWVSQNPQYGEFVMFDEQPVKKKDQAVPSLGEQGGLPSQQPSVQPRKAKEERFFGGAFGNLLDALDMPTPGVPGSGLGIGDFIDDMGRAFSSGKKAGVNISTSRPLFFSGPGSSDEEVQNFVKAGTEYTGPSDEATKFYKDYEDSGKTTFGFVKALSKNPGVAPELVVQSASQFLFNPEARAAFGASIAAGAGIGAVASAPLGGVGAAPGAIAAILPGVAAANTAVSTLSSFSELMKQELDQRGLEFNEDNVRTILEDEKALRKIRAKSAGYGIAIGAFDLATAKVGGAIAAKIPMTTRAGKIKSTLATTGVEAVGGSAGEAAARGVTGQELDPAEIGLEGIAEIPGAAPTLLSQVLKRPTYKINGEFVGQADVDDILQNSSRQELENTKFEVFNDVNTYGEKFRNRLEDLGLLEEITEANPNASETDINRLFELNSKLKKVENLNSESAKASADWLRSQIKEVQDGLLTQEFTPQEPTITLDVERIGQAAPEATQMAPAEVSPEVGMEVPQAEQAPQMAPLEDLEFDNIEFIEPVITPVETQLVGEKKSPLIKETFPAQEGVKRPRRKPGEVRTPLMEQVTEGGVFKAKVRDSRTGTEFIIEDPELSLDLAIAAQVKESGRTAFPQPAFLEAFNEVIDADPELQTLFPNISETGQPLALEQKVVSLDGRKVTRNVVQRMQPIYGALEQRMENAEEIPMSEIESVVDQIIQAQQEIQGQEKTKTIRAANGVRQEFTPLNEEQKRIFNNFTESLVNKLLSYEFATTTTTGPATQKTTAAGLIATPREGRPLQESRVQREKLDGAEVTVEGRGRGRISIKPLPGLGERSVYGITFEEVGAQAPETISPTTRETGTTPAAVGVEPQTEQDVRQETNAPQEGRGQGEDVTPVPQEEGRQEGQITPPAVAQEGETPPATAKKPTKQPPKQKVESTPAAFVSDKKVKYKREDFPDSQANTRTPVTQKLLDYFAEVAGIPKFTEDLSKGTYISWLQNSNPVGYGVADTLNSPQKAFDVIAKYDAELAALAQKPRETPPATGKKPRKTEQQEADERNAADEELKKTLRSLKAKPGGGANIDLTFGVVPITKAVWNAAIDTAILAIDAGQSIAQAVKAASDYISSRVDGDWGKAKFEQYMEERFSKSSPKSKAVFHAGTLEGKGNIYVSPIREQANEYSSMSGAPVLEFEINENAMAPESEVRDLIRSLGLKLPEGYNLDELFLYEALDTRVKSSLSQGDIDKLYAALKDKGYEGIAFRDEDIRGIKKEGIDNFIVFEKISLNQQQAQPEAQVEATAKALEEAVKDNPAKFIQEENGFRITGGIFDIQLAAREADKIQDVKTPSSLSFLPKTLTLSHLARSKKDKNNILKNGFDINQASIESSIKGAYFSSEDWSTMDRFGRVKEDSLYVDIDNDGLLYFDSLDSFVDYLKSNNFPYEGQTLTDSQMQKLKDNGVKGILLREDFASQARNELIVIDDSIIKNISESPKDITKLPSSFSNIKEIAEAYHKAKADRSGPKLVQAVEGLLGQTAPEAKPAKTIAEQRKEFRETAKKYFDGLKKMGVAFDPESNSKEDIAFLKALAKYIKLELDAGMVTFKGFLEKTANLIEGFNEKAVVSAAKEAWAKEVVKAYPKLYAKYSAAKRKELEREIKDIKKTMIRKIRERTDPKIVNFKSQLKTEKRRLSKEAAAQLAAINNAYDLKTMMAMEPQDLMELLNLTEGIYKEGRSEIKALNESLDEAAQIQGEEMLAAISSKNKRLDKLEGKEVARRKLANKAGIVVAIKGDDRIIMKEEKDLEALDGEGYTFLFLNTISDKAVDGNLFQNIARFFSENVRSLRENARDLRTGLELIKSGNKQSQDFINGLVEKMNKASVEKARKEQSWSKLLKEQRKVFFGSDLNFRYTNWMQGVPKIKGKPMVLRNGGNEKIGGIDNAKIVTLFRQMMDPTNLVKTKGVRKIDLSDESIRQIIDYMNLPENKAGKGFALSLNGFFEKVAMDTAATLEENGYNAKKLEPKRYNKEDFADDAFIGDIMNQLSETRTEGFIPYTPIQATESPDTVQGAQINEDDLLNPGDVQKNFSVISNNMITRKPGGVIVPTDIRQTLNSYTAGMANMNAKLPILRDTQAIFSKKNLTAMSNAFAPQFAENLKSNYISFMTDRVTPVSSSKSSAAFKTWLMTSTAIPMFFNPKSALLQLLAVPNFMVSYDVTRYLSASKKLISDPVLFKDLAVQIINLPTMRQRFGGRFSPDSRVVNEEMKRYGNLAITLPLTNLKISAKELLAKGYLPSSLGDIGTIAIGGAPVYYDILQRNKAKYLAQGMSEDQASARAKSDAEEKLFEIIQETQQSSEAMYLSEFQKQSFTRLFTSFATATQQYYRKARRAAARMKNKEGNQLQNAYEVLHYTAINAMFFQFASSVLVDWLSGPGEDELEEMSRQERMDLVRYMESVMETVAQGTGGIGVALQAIILASKEMAKSGKPEKVLESVLRTMPAARIKYDAGLNALREWKRGDYVRAFTKGGEVANIPTDRIRALVVQVSEALTENLEAQERIARITSFRTESWMREKREREIWNGVQSAVDKSTPAERQRAISNTKSAYRDLFQLYGKRYAEATTEAEKARVDSIASKELLNVYNHRQGGPELTEELQKLFNQSAEFNSLPKDLQKLKNMETNRKIGDVVEEVLSLEKKSEKKAMEYWSSLVNNGILSDKEIERIREEYNTRKGLQ